MWNGSAFERSNGRLNVLILNGRPVIQSLFEIGTYALVRTRSEFERPFENGGHLVFATVRIPTFKTFGNRRNLDFEHSVFDPRLYYYPLQYSPFKVRNITSCCFFSILSEQLGRPVSSTFALLGNKFQNHGHSTGSPHKKKRNSMRGSIRKCRSKPNLTQDEDARDGATTPLSRSRGKYRRGSEYKKRLNTVGI